MNPEPIRAFSTAATKTTPETIATLYRCLDDGELEIEVTAVLNHWTALGRQPGAYFWSVRRGGQIIRTGRADVEIGDYMSRPCSWQEQVEAFLGGTIEFRTAAEHLELERRRQEADERARRVDSHDFVGGVCRRCHCSRSAVTHFAWGCKTDPGPSQS